MTALKSASSSVKLLSVPVVMLTAKGDDMDKILGLEYGADDYITKPFNILEVKGTYQSNHAPYREKGSRADKEQSDHRQEILRWTARRDASTLQAEK